MKAWLKNNMKLEDMFKKCLENEYLSEYNIPEQEIKDISNKIDEEILKKNYRGSQNENL